jgi:hypothetical protein
MPADMIFTSDSGGTTKIPWEVESYDAVNGVLWAWVKIATVSHTSNTVFYVFYDDASVTTQQNTSSFAPSAVWDANYKAVYHLPDGTTLNAKDSTSNAFDGTVGVSASATTGQIDGGGASINSGNSYITNASFTLGGSGAVTVSCWLNVASFASNMMLIEKEPVNGDWELFVQSSQIWLRGSSTTNIAATPPSTGTWHYIVGTISGTSAIIYIDGVNSASGTVAAIANTTDVLNIGRYSGAGGGFFLVGSLDEGRVSNIARGQDWITAEYNNQLNPTSFITLGGETPIASSIFGKMVGLFQAVNRASTY